MLPVHRSPHNPILKPEATRSWEAYATFNGSPVRKGKPGKQTGPTHLLYRAQSKPKRFGNTSFSMSTVGCAKKLPDGTWGTMGQLIAPLESWERYGCEDPRGTYMNGSYYIFYTALSVFPFGAPGIKVAVAISDDLKTVRERHLVTPFNAKAMSLFPEKVNGKYTVIFAAHTDEPPAKIAIAQFSDLEDIWNEDKWRKWHDKIDDHLVRIPHRDGEQVEVGAPPVKTPYGWILIYSHIDKYYTPNDKIFGIQAVLLDIDDPRKIIAQTRGPFMVPETTYEKDGLVPNITFPSGAMLAGDTIHLFYGGADTVCATAELSLQALLASMNFTQKSEAKNPKDAMPKDLREYRETHTLRRLDTKPMMKPLPNRPWGSRAVFNPAAVEIDGTTYILFRAMSEDNTSVVGCAESYDMRTATVRSAVPVYTPRAPFEQKNVPGGNSGCEDPRLTRMGDRVYMTYTAFNGTDVPHIALTSIAVEDMKAGIWKWTTPILVSKDGVDDKDGALFPEKIKGKYALIHRVNHMVCVDYSPTLEFKNRNEFKDNIILKPRPGMWDSRKVGIAMPPFLVDSGPVQGWVMMYHGIGDDGVYRAGAALLDKNNIQQVLGRTAYPLFEPEMDYEKNGQIGNVVFPCGLVMKKMPGAKSPEIFVYYGGADSVVAVASISLKNILETLK